MPIGCLNQAPAAKTTHTAAAAAASPTRFAAVVAAAAGGAEHGALGVDLHRGVHRQRGESVEPPPPLSNLFLFSPIVQQLVNLWMQQLLMWPRDNTFAHFLQQQQKQQSNGGFVDAGDNREVDEAARMHVLHGPPGAHHLHERQDDDDYVGGGGGGGGTGMAVNFGALVKKYYERIVESASENKK